MGGLSLIFAFVAFTTAGEVVAVLIGLVVDQINENLSMLLFFVMSAIVVCAAWPLAVRMTSKADA